MGCCLLSVALSPICGSAASANIYTYSLNLHLERTSTWLIGHDSLIILQPLIPMRTYLFSLSCFSLLLLLRAGWTPPTSIWTYLFSSSRPPCIPTPYHSHTLLPFQNIIPLGIPSLLMSFFARTLMISISHQTPPPTCKKTNSVSSNRRELIPYCS